MSLSRWRLAVVVLTVLFIVLLLMTLDFAVQRLQVGRARRQMEVKQRARRLAARAADLLPNDTTIPAATTLCSSHCWLARESAGDAKVGIDHLLASLMGPPDSVEIIPPGTLVDEGDVVAVLRRGERRLCVRAPIGGRIEDVNMGINEHPSVIAAQPYGDGWLCRIVPGPSPRWPGQPTASASQWFQRERSRLVDILAQLPPLAPVGQTLADGGELSFVELQGLEPGVWQEMVGRLVAPAGNSSTRSGGRQ